MQMRLIDETFVGPSRSAKNALGTLPKRRGFKRDEVKRVRHVVRGGARNERLRKKEGKLMKS